MLIELSGNERMACREPNLLCVEGTRIKIRELIEEYNRRINSITSQQLVEHTCPTCFTASLGYLLNISKLDGEARRLGLVIGFKPPLKYRGLVERILGYTGKSIANIWDRFASRVDRAIPLGPWY